MPFKDAVPFGSGANVYDGDTVYQGGQGFRLYGIDTEEMKRKGVQPDSQPEPSHGATEAQQYLANIMANEQVSFEEKGSDMYGRKVVRVIGEDGRDINEELVRNAGAGLMSFNNEVSPYAPARADYLNRAASGEVVMEQGAAFDPTKVAPTRSVTQEFSTGMERGSDMLGAMAGKAIEVLGDVTGVESISQKGRDTAARYLEQASAIGLKPQTNSYKDVGDFRSGMNYVASILGEQAPQMVADAVAAGVGALTGAGVGAIPAVAARRGALAAAVHAVAGTAATGAKRGAMSSMFTQALGESAMELEAEGIDERGAAIAAAFAKMGADYAGTMAMFRTAKRMAFDGNAVTSRIILGEATKSIGWEGGTEALQTVIDKAAVAYHKDGYDILSDENIEEIINSAIAGAVVGGAVSGTAGGGRAMVDKLFTSKEAKTDANPVEEAAIPQEEALAPQEEVAVPPSAAPAPDDVVQEVPVSPGFKPGSFDVSQYDLSVPFGQEEATAPDYQQMQADEYTPEQDMSLFAAVDEPVSLDYNNGQNNEGDTVDNQPSEFTPRSEVHKRFQQGVDKLSRGRSAVDAALGVDRTAVDVQEEKPLTAQARADSAKQDLYEGAVKFGEENESDSDALSGDSVTMSETAKKRTIADAVSKGMAVAENMKQTYRLSRYKDDDVETGAADVADMRSFEKENSVGSSRKMNAKFVPTDSYMKRRMVRIKPQGSDEWFNVDFRTLLEEVYNSRDIDTTEKNPLPHKRVLNQLSYVLGELADNGVEIQSYDTDGKPSEQAIDPENTIVCTPAKDLRDIYQGSEGNELTVADVHAHEMAANSTNEKERNRYAKLNPATIVDDEDALAENIDLLQDAMTDARENQKDPDVIPYLRRAIRRAGGVADGKDVGTLLREAEHAHAQGKNRLAKIRRDSPIEVGGNADGDASDVYDGLALDAISRKQSGKDFFAEASVATKRGTKKEDSGATQAEPVTKEAASVTFSLRNPSEISGAARAAVTSLIEASGLKSKVVITTDVSSDTRSRAAPASIRFENGQAIVELNMAEVRGMDANKQDVVTTLVAHELGHAWMQEKGLRIPAQALSDLHEAYRKARAAAPAGHVYRKQKGVGFDEWFADQFMTYALRKSKASASPTQKYFAKVWNGISKIINSLGKSLFGADRFSESETGLAFVSSVFRTVVNDKPMTANKFDRMLADSYEELFGTEAPARVGAGERRATTEARALGDAKTVAEVALFERKYSAAKTQHRRALADRRVADAARYEKSMEDARKQLDTISATEPRDFYARAFFQQYGGVAGAQRIFQGAVRHAKDAAVMVSPVWATSIRRLKQLGHHALGTSYEKQATDITAEMRLWMAQLDGLKDADMDALSSGVKTKAVDQFLDKFFKHLKRDGGMPTLGKVSKDYVPRMFDRTAIDADQTAFRQFLQQEAMTNAQYNLTDEEANGIIKTLLKDDSAYYQLDASGGAAFAGNAAARSLNFLNDLSLQKTPWVIQDKRTMLAGYVHSMLKRATYEKHFGGYHEVLDTDQKPATLLRYHMQNIPFRARDLGITTGEERRMATEFEKKRFFEKDASTRQVLDLAASASARGWVKIDAQPSTSGKGFSIKYSMYEPSYTQNQILREYRRNGEQDKANEFVRISDALSGRLGQDAMSPTARKLSGVIMTYENVLTLLFASLSSFPDLVGPIVRSRDFAGVRDALKGMVEVMGQTTDAKERRKLLHDFGVAHRTTTEQALLEVYGAQFMSGTAQKVNDAFFKYTGLEAVTAFGRTMSASVALRFLQRHGKQAAAGDTESARYLKELGLTPQEADSLNGSFKTLPQMLSDGTAFDANGAYTAEAQTAEKVLFAINQFVDESVVRPDSTQRPVWASDPRFMLVWHLKSFAYSYTKVIMKPVFKEAMYQYQKHGISPKVAVPLLTFALPVMLASALGLRLREIVQYDIPHEMGFDELERPSEERPFDEYLYDVLRRGGILGPAELAINAMEADDKKRSALITLLGPTADHFNTLLQFDAYKAVTRSVPVLSQMPEFKVWMFNEMK